LVRRKKINYAVKSQMQMRLFVSVMVVVLISVGFMALSFYIFANQEAGNSYKQFHVNVKSLLDMLLPAVVVASLVGLLTAAFVSIFLPLKWAGPVYRIEEEIKSGLDKGSLNMNFNLRDGDEFSELAGSLDQTFAKVRERVVEVKAASKDLKGALASIESSPDVEAAVKKLDHALRDLKS
jgi:methyl-accepting chemotaxis protein